MSHWNPNTVPQPLAAGGAGIHTAAGGTMTETLASVRETYDRIKREASPYGTLEVSSDIPSEEIVQCVRSRGNFDWQAISSLLKPNDAFVAIEVFHDRAKAEKLLENEAQRLQYETTLPDNNQYPFEINSEREASISRFGATNEVYQPIADVYARIRAGENKVRSIGNTIKHGGASPYILVAAGQDTLEQYDKDLSDRINRLIHILQTNQKALADDLKDFKDLFEVYFPDTVAGTATFEGNVKLEIDRISLWLFMDRATPEGYFQLAYSHIKRHLNMVRKLYNSKSDRFEGIKLAGKTAVQVPWFITTLMRDCGCLDGVLTCEAHHDASSSSVSSTAGGQVAIVNRIPQARHGINVNTTDNNELFAMVAQRVFRATTPHEALACEQTERAQINASHQKSRKIVDPQTVAPQNVPTATEASYLLLKAFTVVWYDRKRYQYDTKVNQYPFHVNVERDGAINRALGEMIETASVLELYQAVRTQEDQMRLLGCSLRHGGATDFIAASPLGEGLETYNLNRQARFAQVTELASERLSSLQSDINKLRGAINTLAVANNDIALEIERLEFWVTGEKEALRWYEDQIEFHLAQKETQLVQNVDNPTGSMSGPSSDRESPSLEYLRTNGVPIMRTCGCMEQVYYCDEHSKSRHAGYSNAQPWVSAPIADASRPAPGATHATPATHSSQTVPSAPNHLSPVGPVVEQTMYRVEKGFTITNPFNGNEFRFQKEDIVEVVDKGKVSVGSDRLWWTVKIGNELVKVPCNRLQAVRTPKVAEVKGRRHQSLEPQSLRNSAPAVRSSTSGNVLATNSVYSSSQFTALAPIVDVSRPAPVATHATPTTQTSKAVQPTAIPPPTSHYIAIKDFEPEVSSDIHLTKGQVVEVLEKKSDFWFSAVNQNGVVRKGVVPKDCLKPLEVTAPIDVRTAAPQKQRHTRHQSLEPQSLRNSAPAVRSSTSGNVLSTNSGYSSSQFTALAPIADASRPAPVATHATPATLSSQTVSSAPNHLPPVGPVVEQTMYRVEKEFSITSPSNGKELRFRKEDVVEVVDKGEGSVGSERHLWTVKKGNEWVKVPFNYLQAVRTPKEVKGHFASSGYMPSAPFATPQHQGQPSPLSNFRRSTGPVPAMRPTQQESRHRQSASVPAMPEPQTTNRRRNFFSPFSKVANKKA